MPRLFARSLVLLLLPIFPLGAGAAAGPSQPRLRLSGGDFLPRSGETAAPGWYDAPAVAGSAAGRRYLVAIARGPLDAGERRSLEQAGAELLDYLPVYGYRLRAAPETESAIRALPFVLWLGELPPWRKVESALASRAAAPGREDAKLRVILTAGEPQMRVLTALAGLRAESAPAGKGGAWRVTATVPPGQLANVLSRLLALPEVEAVESVKPMRLFNQDAVWVHQSFVGPSPQQTPRLVSERWKLTMQDLHRYRSRTQFGRVRG